MEGLSYLVFEFSSSSFLGGRSGSTTHATLLRPQRGHSYDVRVSYRTHLYNVPIRELGPRGGAGREVERVGLDACRRRGT